MNLLEDLSDFIGSPIVTRDVEFKGKTRTFNFRELSAGEAEGLFLGIDADPKKNAGLRNRILQMALCDAAGAAVITEKDAAKLPNELANKLQAIVLEVNGIGKTAEGDAKKD